VRIDADARASFELRYSGQRARVDLQIAGEHQTANAAAAATMALAAGLPLSQIASALSSAEVASRWRMEVHHRSDGVTIINDAYNANPESMRAALKALVAMGENRRTWAVLGMMGELGEDSRDEHDALGRMVVRLDVSKLLAVGEDTRPLYLGASLEGSWGDEAAWVADVDEAITRLHDELRSGDVVLIKASRSVGLERVAQALLEEERA
jgi:UDP-N-acetylmuramoyl-tripeptide--D-alanyl-D-alanine ligase